MANNAEIKRADPDALLRSIQKANRGKLTIFLGAAAGVGKTYAMLEAAHERLSKGIDVHIGWVETHGRVETQRLCAGIPQIPPKTVIYRERSMEEMDVDAILAQKPQIVLVDELAHTNVPGSRHVRRYQDVEELLQGGINVYTTLNIQHIESLNDVVMQITGITVHETVPDHVLEEADQVQLIDIPPEELIQRLKEGKVYVPHQAQRALQNFFREGNINALRELALRRTADRVDKQLNEYMRDHKIAGPWPTAERVMVCVSASPFSAHLIRAARRLAAGMQSEWIAVYVETPRRLPMTESERDRLARNLRLAEKLGAKTATVAGQDVADELIMLARTHNVTHIIIGKPLHSRLWEILHGSVVDSLIRKSGGISIHVIQGKASPHDSSKQQVPLKISWGHYFGALGLLALITGLSWLGQPYFNTVNIALLYNLPILFSAVRGGIGPSIITAGLSVLLFDYFFVTPTFSFTVYDLRYLLSFSIYLVVAVVASIQARRLKQQVTLARDREKYTSTLYELSRKVAAESDLEVIADIVVERAADTFGRHVLLLMPGEGGSLVLWAERHPEHKSTTAQQRIMKQPLHDANEAAVAAWVYQHGETAGRGTETLPGSNFMYIPIKSTNKIAGVLGIRMAEKHITPEQCRLLEAWGGLVGVAVERVLLVEQAKQADLVVESDRLRTALFNSISHELRTPLASIIGAVSSLLDADELFSANQRKELLETVKKGAARMDRLVGNLLDTARLESGMMELKKDWCDLEDIVGAALRRLQEATKDRPISIEIPHERPLLFIDCVLIEQVIINLLDNALKYSPPNSPIVISTGLFDNNVFIKIADSGIGIPEEELAKVFDKFYRLKYPKHVSGTGLGLSICKGIVEAHNGKIWAENQPEGGLTVVVSLPMDEKQPSLSFAQGERTQDE